MYLLDKSEKKNSPRELILQHFLHLQHTYPYTTFYTDASKSASAVPCAAHGPNFTSTKTLNANCSIFTAEAYGILITVEYITETNIQQSVIFTDSLSVVMALHLAKPSKNPVLNQLIRKIMSAYGSDMRIIVCWMPGHSSIRGNEIADRYAAAAALRTHVDEPLVPYLDMKLQLYDGDFVKCGSRNGTKNPTRNYTQFSSFLVLFACSPPASLAAPFVGLTNLFLKGTLKWFVNIAVLL